MEKEQSPEPGGGGRPWLSGPLGYVPRKFGELKAFLSETRAELKKVTWPARPEVYSTTIVVIITTVFFGFYLYGLDLGFSWILQRVLK